MQQRDNIPYSRCIKIQYLSNISDLPLKDILGWKGVWHMNIKTIISVMKCPRSILFRLGGRELLNWIPDTMYLKMMYWSRFGKILDIAFPKTFNEKLQWIKINDRKPEYSIYADKYAVREYIAKEIGEKYLVPLIGFYNSVEEIKWNDLPNQFVMKCTHGSGANIICKDKNILNIKEAAEKLSKWLNRNWYWSGREWPYKNIKPRIICEKFLSDTNNTPDDYKVLCFNGRAKLIEVHRDRYGNHRQDFYDTSWEKTRISQDEMPITDMICEKPQLLKEMLEMSEKLSKSIPHIRIDWYIVGSQLYFGEMTFFDGSGFCPFNNEDDDLMLGSWLDLPIC